MLLVLFLDCSVADAPFQKSPRTEFSYALPDVTITTQENQRVSLSEVLNFEGTILLNFIFTSCNAVCPVMSAVFSKVQAETQNFSNKIRLVSISIDPEQDTPAKLKLYANKFNAGKNWFFLTGSISEIEKIQTAFNVYRGDKMNHASLTLIRPPKSNIWYRIESLSPSSELIDQIHN